MLPSMLTMLGQMYCWEVIIFYTPSQSRVFFGKKKKKKRKKKNPGYENRFVEIYTIWFWQYQMRHLHGNGLISLPCGKSCHLQDSWRECFKMYFKIFFILKYIKIIYFLKFIYYKWLVDDENGEKKNKSIEDQFIDSGRKLQDYPQRFRLYNILVV